MINFHLGKITCAILLVAASVVAAPAQTFKTLVSFDSTNGSNPQTMSLIQGIDGNLYGTTYGGGSNSAGTIFRVTPAGVLSTLYSFCSTAGCTDGSAPYAGLIQATDGNFYGTTSTGGANTVGTIFKITAKGVLTTLYSFCSQSSCSDGQKPFAGLIQSTDGNFYGTTVFGGDKNSGTVFQLTPKGVYTRLYSFCAQSACTDGQQPTAALVQANNGLLYGTTSNGGATTAGAGSVFQITSTGTLTTLHSFATTDGGDPASALIQATDGNLYGTTVSGGADGTGTVYKISLTGTFSTLTNLGTPNGVDPFASVIQATDGKFYGTTDAGGSGFEGNVFKMGPGGTVTPLYEFCAQTSCPDGNNPLGALVQATNGTLYGVTQHGGTSTACSGGCGTIFSLTIGQGAFVETRPTAAKVGATVIILGTNFAGTTKVFFNGTAATFTVVSKTEIKATVPAAATTGKVAVVTPTKTLTSNLAFRVKP